MVWLSPRVWLLIIVREVVVARILDVAVVFASDGLVDVTLTGLVGAELLVIRALGLAAVSVVVT